MFGHRDNTNQRGSGDPGDEVFARLAAIGADGVWALGRPRRRDQSTVDVPHSIAPGGEGNCQLDPSRQVEDDDPRCEM